MEELDLLSLRDLEWFSYSMTFMQITNHYITYMLCDEISNQDKISMEAECKYLLGLIEP
jgi:hypothetical protein